MEIRRFKSELLYSNMYIITENGHAIVVDPCQNINALGNNIVDMILLTHEHYDHISGVNLWKEITGAPVWCSKMCAEHIKDPRKNMSRYFKEFCELQTWVKLEESYGKCEDYSCEADYSFEDKKQLMWLGHYFKLFELPGHSEGSIGILLDEKHFFSGDSLLEETEIELRLPGGNKKKWIERGAPRLAQVPYDITVYPGHFKEFKYYKKGDN